MKVKRLNIFRIEYSGGAIHGHPVTKQQFLKKYKNKILDPDIRKMRDLPEMDPGF